jgi:hypothetical protein
VLGYVRLYADAAGDSRFEDVAVEAVPLELVAGMPPAGLSGPFPGGDFYLLEIPAEQREDGWHTAPRRQWILHLTGTTEIETSAGEVRRFGPGTLLLAEDTTGKGHNSRTINEGGQLMLFIPILEDAT